MSAQDEFESPSSPRPPRGQSAGDAMLRRRFARQLGGEEAPPPAARPQRRPPPPPQEAPFLGPPPQGRPPRPPQNPQPAPPPRRAAPPPEPLAPLEEEPLDLEDFAEEEDSPPPPSPPPEKPRARNLEDEFLAAFSEDPPAPAGEDFLSEFAREPAPQAAEGRPQDPRSAPDPESEPEEEKPAEARPSVASLRGAMQQQVAQSAAEKPRKGDLIPSGAKGANARAAAKAAESAESRKRSREFALNFERLRKFGFITPSARRSRLSEEIRLIKRRLIRRMTLEESGAAGRRPGRGRAPRGRQHVILFTSAKPSEGKSFIAVNLALSIILDEGLNVLLVDADAARPSLSKILGLKPNLKGLTDLLEEARHGRSDVSGRMLRTPDYPLTFIPAGEAVESATDLFGGDAMRSLMADLADRYSDRIILIDGPPLLASTEPVELARHAGQVVMVVDAERTTRKAVEAALDLLGPENNVNLVLNKATASGRLEQFGSYYEAYANDSAPRKS